MRAVDGVSFEVGDGEFLALIGPNGAGKSTCFNMINGQLAPDGGDVRFGERSIVGMLPRESGGSASAAPSRSRRRSAP